MTRTNNYPMTYEERRQYDLDQFYERTRRIRDEKMLQDRMALKARDAVSTGIMLGAAIGVTYYSSKLIWWIIKNTFKLLYWSIKGFVCWIVR